MLETISKINGAVNNFIWGVPAMILLMIESVASFAWFIRWFGRVVPGKPSEAVADAAPLPGSMRLVLIVLIVMSLISSVIAATWLQ